DSKSAIAISCNPVQHSRTKHIAVRYQFIKEHVEMDRPTVDSQRVIRQLRLSWRGDRGGEVAAVAVGYGGWHGLGGVVVDCGVARVVDSGVVWQRGGGVVCGSPKVAGKVAARDGE
nr:retrotransposon protein, putative, unclassified [Tanacetum cinerariifolium]